MNVLYFYLHQRWTLTDCTILPEATQRRYKLSCSRQPITIDGRIRRRKALSAWSNDKVISLYRNMYFLRYIKFSLPVFIHWHKCHVFFRELETENANLQEEYQVLKASSSSSTTNTTGSSAPHSTGSSSGTGVTSSRYTIRSNPFDVN